MAIFRNRKITEIVVFKTCPFSFSNFKAKRPPKYDKYVTVDTTVLKIIFAC